MQKINLQEPQRNRNANANFVNLIRTSTVLIKKKYRQLMHSRPVQRVHVHIFCPFPSQTEYTTHNLDKIIYRVLIQMRRLVDWHAI